MMRRIIVTGSLAFDQIANFPGRFRDQIQADKLHVLNISFLVDNLRREFGGTGGNIAYNLALFGLRPKLVASLGSDGREYLMRLDKYRIDATAVNLYSKTRTAVGSVITDKDDNQIWVFYSGAMKNYTPLPRLTKSNLVILSPNDPKVMARYMQDCIRQKAEFMFDPAFQIPVLSKETISLGLKHAKIVIGNDYEMALLRQKTQNLKLKAQILITTMGGKGSEIEYQGKKIKIPAAKVKKIVDPTGAGDAYRAGFIAGYINNEPLETCGRMGATCAAYTVEKYGTQTHSFTQKQFNERLKCLT